MPNSKRFCQQKKYEKNIHICINNVEASPYWIKTSRQQAGPSQRSASAPPVINMDNGLPPLPPWTALNLLTDYQSRSSAEPNPEKSPNDTVPPTHHTSSPSPSRRPLLINPAHVTPTRQEPIQVSLNEAVDLLNELRMICDTLLPGHGQFLCHFIYTFYNTLDSRTNHYLGLPYRLFTRHGTLV